MDMTRAGILVGTTLLGSVLALTGCGTENGASPTNGEAGAAAQGDTASTSAADVDASNQAAQASDDLGTVIVNQRLAITAAEYPLPDVPAQAEVADAAELAEVFAAVPGIEDIAAQVEASQATTADRRLFAYTTNACITDDVSLKLDGMKVSMIVSGTATIRCQPPTTLVVWAVSTDVPADAKPSATVQK